MSDKTLNSGPVRRLVRFVLFNHDTAKDFTVKTIHISLTLSDEAMQYFQECGEAEWGVVSPKPDADHITDFVSTLKKTREWFPQIPENAGMHGVYMKGTTVVMAHTGISPKAPIRASLLAALWNEALRVISESNATDDRTPTTDHQTQDASAVGVPVNHLVGQMPKKDTK